jgi:hypothetical protein
MSDLDGRWDCSPLYRSRGFAPQILRLNALQVGRGHDRYRLVRLLADERRKNKGRLNKMMKKGKCLEGKEEESG